MENNASLNLVEVRMRILEEKVTRLWKRLSENDEILGEGVDRLRDWIYNVADFIKMRLEPTFNVIAERPLTQEQKRVRTEFARILAQTDQMKAHWKESEGGLHGDEPMRTEDGK
jgi:hypothetical protein